MGHGKHIACSACNKKVHRDEGDIHCCIKCRKNVCGSCSRQAKKKSNDFGLSNYLKARFNVYVERICLKCEYFEYFYRNHYKRNKFFIFGHTHSDEDFSGGVIMTDFLNFLKMNYPYELSAIRIFFESARWGREYGSYSSMYVSKKKREPFVKEIKRAYGSNLIPESFIYSYIDNSMMTDKEKNDFLEYSDIKQVRDLFETSKALSVPIYKYDSEEATGLQLIKDDSGGYRYGYDFKSVDDEEKEMYRIKNLKKNDLWEDSFRMNNGKLEHLRMELGRVRQGNKAMAQNLHEICYDRKMIEGGKFFVIVGAGHTFERASFDQNHMVNMGLCNSNFSKIYNNFLYFPLQDHLIRYGYRVYTAFLPSEGMEFKQAELQRTIKKRLFIKVVDWLKYCNAPIMLTQRYNINSKMNLHYTYEAYLGKNTTDIIRWRR
ncbi:MAG: hypothetical protein GY750_08275 [Lentisphaerae bacterium]|nr:hypothetical protein [Lentisphaerota bacterium]MCP4101405.1 hypothetical protein [Lentisphaerota bacterium]